MPDPLNQGERQIVGGLGGTRVALLKWVRPSFALRWLLVTAFALVLQVHAWGQTDRSEITNQVDTVQAFRQGILVDTFGKWEIRTGLIDHTISWSVRAPPMAKATSGCIATRKT